MSSKYFGHRELLAINKIGDVFSSGDPHFPSFSKLGCVEHIDELLESMPQKDRKDLSGLLVVFSFFPKFLLSLFFHGLEFAWEHEWPLPSVLRLIRIGVRGVVLSLYYSGLKGSRHQGPSPLEVIGYRVNVK